MDLDNKNIIVVAGIYECISLWIDKMQFTVRRKR